MVDLQDKEKPQGNLGFLDLSSLNLENEFNSSSTHLRFAEEY